MNNNGLQAFCIFKMSRISSLKKALNKIYVGDNIVSISELRYLPRWIILFIDIVIILISILISYEIVFGLGVRPLNSRSLTKPTI